MRKTLAASTMALASFISTAHAEPEGEWQVLLGTWSYDPSGTVTDQGSQTSGNVTYDVDSDLDMSSGDSGYYRIAWEKPGTSRGNVGFFMYDVESTGGCTANNTTRECDDGTGGGGGGLFPGNPNTTEVTATAEASAPTVAWWGRVGNEILTFDLGISLSYVDGTVVVRTETDPVSDDEFNTVIPAVYTGLNLYARPNLRFHVRANGVSSGSEAFLAVEYGVSWKPIKNGRFGFGAEAGYRSFDVEIDNTDNGDQVDIELDGAYVGALLSF